MGYFKNQLIETQETARVKKYLLGKQMECEECGGFGYQILCDDEHGEYMVGCVKCWVLEMEATEQGRSR